MSRHRERAELAGWCSVVVRGFAMRKMEQMDQGLAVTVEDKMVLKRWKKCQKTFSYQSLRSLSERDDMHRDKGEDGK